MVGRGALCREHAGPEGREQAGSGRAGGRTGEGACASEPLAPLADAQRNRLCVAYLSAKDWLCRLPVEGEVAVDCVVVPIVFPHVHVRLIFLLCVPF